MELRSGDRQLRSQSKSSNKQVHTFQIDTPKTLSKPAPKRKPVTKTKESKKDQPQQHVFISENIQVAKTNPKNNKKNVSEKSSPKIENYQNTTPKTRSNNITYQTNNVVNDEMFYQIPPENIYNEPMRKFSNTPLPSKPKDKPQSQSTSPYNVFSAQGNTETNPTPTPKNPTVSKPPKRPTTDNYSNTINFFSENVSPKSPVPEPKKTRSNGFKQGHNPKYNEGVLDLSQPYYISSPLGRTNDAAPSKTNPALNTNTVDPLPKKQNPKQSLSDAPNSLLQVLSPRARSPDAPTSRGSFSQFQIDPPLRKANRHNGKSKIALRFNRLSLPSSDPYEVPGREVELSKTVQIAPAHPPLDLEDWDDLVDRVITIRANICDSLTVFILWLDGKCTAHLFDEVKSKSPQKLIEFMEDNITYTS